MSHSKDGGRSLNPRSVTGPSDEYHMSCAFVGDDVGGFLTGSDSASNLGEAGVSPAPPPPPPTSSGVSAVRAESSGTSKPAAVESMYQSKSNASDEDVSCAGLVSFVEPVEGPEDARIEKEGGWADVFVGTTGGTSESVVVRAASWDPRSSERGAAIEAPEATPLRFLSIFSMKAFGSCSASSSSRFLSVS